MYSLFYTFIISFAICYIWHILGVTIGYHRLLAHRSFKCPKLVEYFWVLAGYLAFESSPLWWATVHRAHHRHTDTPLDPHAPKDGWKHAYYGWFFLKEYPSHIDPAIQGKDLVKDPLYRFLDQNGDWHKAHLLNSFIGFGSRIVLGFIIGWPIALGSLAAGLTVQQVPLLLNVMCHIPKLGYKNFATEDDSVNVWWVAMLTAGEGWHNNHHAFPGSARSGFRFKEIDLSWYVICLMKKLKLVSWTHEESIWSIYKPKPLSPALSSPPRLVSRQERLR